MRCFSLLAPARSISSSRFSRGKFFGKLHLLLRNGRFMRLEGARTAFKLRTLDSQLFHPILVFLPLLLGERACLLVCRFCERGGLHSPCGLRHFAACGGFRSFLVGCCRRDASSCVSCCRVRCGCCHLSLGLSRLHRRLHLAALGLGGEGPFLRAPPRLDELCSLRFVGLKRRRLIRCNLPRSLFGGFDLLLGLQRALAPLLDLRRRHAHLELGLIASLGCFGHGLP